MNKQALTSYRDVERAKPTAVDGSGGMVLIGFGEALSAPEVAWNLLDAGFRVAAFIRRGRRVPIRHLRNVRLIEVTAPEDHAYETVDQLCNAAEALHPANSRRLPALKGLLQSRSEPSRHCRQLLWVSPFRRRGKMSVPVYLIADSTNSQLLVLVVIIRPIAEKRPHIPFNAEHPETERYAPRAFSRNSIGPVGSDGPYPPSTNFQSYIR